MFGIGLPELLLLLVFIGIPVGIVCVVFALSADKGPK
jgi:hypothetical protein